MDFPTFILTMLSGDWLFFDEDEIAWDGKHHCIAGIQINGAQLDQFMDFVNSVMEDFEDMQEVVNYFITFLTEVEKDDGLIIPRNAIAPGIQGALRQGDLTGITLANLAACGAAFQVKLQDEDLYIVIHDTRLSAGIPSFFNLMARLLWDLRQCTNSKKGVPFNVVFTGVRNLDANAFIGDVDKAVIGAQENPGTLSVENCPEINFEQSKSEPSESGGETSCFTSFCSGFDDPTEMQEDEELFEAGVLSLARSFPVIASIEGTHVHGRANRIEDIRVGDALTLAADWQTKFFNPVGIEVFNDDGETLGYLNEQFSPSLSGNRELACLLPYITATVETVLPLSQRGSNAKHALMDIRLDLDDRLMEGVSSYLDSAVLRDMKSLLALSKPQRVVLSRSSLGASDLRGSIDTNEALDDPYTKSLSFLDAQNSNSDSGLNSSDAAEAVDDRGSIISMIQLLVLTGQLSGTTFPDELLEKLKRAEEGDMSIDLMALAEEFNNIAPDTEAADLATISFTTGRRAQGKKFSVAVPDGWTVLKDYKEETVLTEIVRPFVIVPHEADENTNISLSDKIIYSSLLGEKDVDETMLECGIPAMKWAVLFCDSYDMSDDMPSMKPTMVWDDEIEAENTTCFAAMADPHDGANGVECYIFPYALDSNDFIRCSFSHGEDLDLEAVKDFVKQLAKSVQLDNPTQPKCEKSLNEALSHKVSSEEFSSMVLSYMKPFVGLRQMVFDAARQKFSSVTEDLNEKALLVAGSTVLADFADRAIPIMSSMIDAYATQARLGATDVDRSEMLTAIERFDSNVFPTPEMLSDEPASMEVVEQSGVFNPSLDLQQVRSRILDLSNGILSSENDIAYDNEPAQLNKMARIAKLEEYKIEALPSIVNAMTNMVSADEYIAISESVGFGMMRSRQHACDSSTSPFNSDEDNVVAMSREFARFNPIIARYVGYMLDIIDAQSALGVDKSELALMANEAEELMSLIADTFSCGNAYLDSVANEKAPVPLPDNYLDLKNHLAILKAR